MENFFKWLNDGAPSHVFALFSLAFAVGFITLVVLSASLLVKGNWLVPLLLWILLPFFYVVRAYVKSKESD